MLSDSLKDAKENFAIITQVSREYGLEINFVKSCVMIFNVREQPEHCHIVISVVIYEIHLYIINTSQPRNCFHWSRPIQLRISHNRCFPSINWSAVHT